MSALSAPVAVALLISALTGSNAPEQEPEAVAASTNASKAAIIITGSRIPRHNLTAVSPVTTIPGDEFKLEGATLTEDLINQLPQVTPDQGVHLAGPGTATVNLRNLGASRTLVLINGRRLLPGDPTYPAADINFVPSSLIQRVEVLTGGATSVYGSDAVSGVVNFILDTRIEGIRVDAQDSYYQHSGRAEPGVREALDRAGIPFPTGNLANGANQDINIAAGHAFFGGRAHITAYGGYRQLSAITLAAREYSACDISADPGRSNTLFCGGSPVSAQGTFVTSFGPLKLGPNQTFVPGFTTFNFSPYVYYQRPGRRYTAGGFAGFDLNSAINPYVEAMYMDDRTVAQAAPSGNFGATTSVNCDNPLLSAQQRSRVCFEGNYIGEVPIFDDSGNLVGIHGSPTVFTDPVTGSHYLRGSLRTLRRNIEGGPRQDTRRHRDLRLVVGIAGKLGPAVSYDASYLASEVKLDENYGNDLSRTRLLLASDVITDPLSGQPTCRSALTGEDPSCVPWNPFAAGGVTPAAAAYIDEPASLGATLKQRVATATATMALNTWGIGSPWSDEESIINVGAEYRKDSLNVRPDQAFQSGDLAGQGQPLIPFNGATRVKELFGEGRFPLLTHGLFYELALEGGYRRSWHSDGSHNLSTDSYKVAVDLIPIRGIRFRASQQRAVRAPNIQELFSPDVQDSFDSDPCAGISPSATQQQCAFTGVTAGQYGKILANPVQAFGGYNSIIGGNRSLGPERSRTRSIGVAIEPKFLSPLNVTVDWYDITLRGAIEEIGAQTIMDTCVATGDRLFCNRIHRDAQGSLWFSPQGYIDNTNANIGGLRVRGVDASANYKLDLGRFGSAGTEFIGSRFIRSVTDNGGLATPFNCSGLYGYPCNNPLPKWRHTLRLTWTSVHGLSMSLHWRHVGGVTLAALRPEFGLTPLVSPLETNIRPQNYFDLTAMFSAKRQYVLRFGARNVLDRKPPLVTDGNPACYTSIQGCSGNTFPQLYDPLGRYIFAGATLNFR